MGEPYGNFDQLRAIPIVTIAHYLGVQIHDGVKVRCPNPAGHSNGDRNPSVSIFRSTNSFKCWVCDDIKGDAIKFAQIFGKVPVEDWRQTSEILSACAGLPPPPLALAPIPKKIGNLLPQHIEGMDALMRLTVKTSPVVSEYLASRKIDPDVAMRAGVRYISGTKEVKEKLLALFGPEHEALHPILNEKGNLRFFLHRMLFPYLTPDHHVVYIQGRDPSKKATTKELATAVPRTMPWLPAGRIQPGRVWICEGVIDALTLLSRGISAIAIPGARTWKKEWANYFADRDVVICLDPDNAGDSGTHDIAGTLISARSVKIAHLPHPNKDINDLARDNLLDDLLSSV